MPDHGRVQHTVLLVRRAGQEGEVHGPPVRGLRHELRAEAGDRRGRVPHEIRPRVPQLLRGAGAEDLQVPVPRAGAHLLGALQGDAGARAPRTLEHALRALHPLRPRVQPARPQRDGGHGRPDGGAVRRGRRGRAGRGGGRTEPRQGEVSPAAPAPRERRRAARVRVCARTDSGRPDSLPSAPRTLDSARPWQTPPGPPVRVSLRGLPLRVFRARPAPGSALTSGETRSGAGPFPAAGPAGFASAALCLGSGWSGF